MSEVTKMNPIAESIQELQTQISKQDELLNILGEKTRAVRIDIPQEQTTKESTPDKERCDIDRDIITSARQIRSNNKRIKAMIDEFQT